MTLIDFVVLIFFGFMFFRGWRMGGIVMLGNIASIFVGAVFTTYIFHWLSTTTWLANWHTAHPALTVLGFIFVMSIVVRLLHIVVNLVNGLYRMASIIPLLGPANSLLGSIVGVLEGTLFVLLAVYLCDNVLFSAGFVSTDVVQTIASTRSYDFAQRVLDHLAFLFPILEIWV